jgi:hypothetical protein
MRKTLLLNNPFDKTSNMVEYHCALELINAVSQYLILYRDEKDQNQKEACRLLFDGAPVDEKDSKLDKMFIELQKKDPESPALRHYQIYSAYPYITQQITMAVLLSRNYVEEVR